MGTMRGLFNALDDDGLQVFFCHGVRFATRRRPLFLALDVVFQLDKPRSIA